jgi:hypothetical protein
MAIVSVVERADVSASRRFGEAPEVSAEMGCRGRRPHDAADFYR